MKFTHTLILAIAASCFFVNSVSADTIPIVNGDFEANGPGFVQADGWDGALTARVADHATFRNQSGLFGGGSNFAFTQNTTDPAEQTLAALFTADFNYTLAANVNYGGPDIGVDGIFELGYDSGAGFVSVGSSVIDLAPLNDGTAANGTNWALATADTVNISTGDAAVGEAIIIRINSSALEGLWFDNVTLDGTAVAVPEPTSTLALIGLAGMFATRRRR